MWDTLKRKLTNFITSLLAYIFVMLIAAVMIIVPTTIVGGCIKLIMMMFGV